MVQRVTTREESVRNPVARWTQTNRRQFGEHDAFLKRAGYRIAKWLKRLDSKPKGRGTI